MTNDKVIRHVNLKYLITEELLFVLYFWGFVLLRPLLQIFPDRSTVILFMFALIIMIVSFYKMLNSKILARTYSIIYFVIFVLLFDMLFRPNGLIITYIYEFLIYGAISIHLLAQVKDSRLLIKLYALFSVVVFIMYFTDPFNGYFIFGDYMTFGFNFALPAYYGLYLGRKVFNNKWYLILEIICLVEIIVFANRSAILGVVFLWLIYNFIYEKGKKEKIIKFISLLALFIILLTSMNYLLNVAVDVMRHFDLFSYSLYHLNLYIAENNWIGMFSGRVEIWELAWNMIRDTNILIGAGTGAFQSKHGFYSHNIFFDLLSQYGIAGLLFALINIIKSNHRFLKQDKYTTIIGFLFLSLWFPKLLFSSYFYKDMGFWCFLAIGSLKIQRNNKPRLID